ncbi:MAG: M20/M25/M40 family metallo-hydrolase [Solirubrobacterales bacterium]
MPSVTPEEGKLAGLVAARMRAIGAEVGQVESLPGRFSIGARITAGRPGPRLILNGHLDTVPPGAHGSWRHPPFAAVVEDGALYGRGACDMKAGLAIMVDVARRIAPWRADLHGELVLHFAIGEERAEPGTRSLLEAGFGGDVGIVLEPTRLQVATAQRGGGALRMRWRGRAAHAGVRDEGINPVDEVPGVIAAIAEYDSELGRRSHPLLLPATLTPTVIAAGEVPNVLPADCEILADRRLLPGEDLDRDIAALRGRLQGLAAATGGVEVVGPEHHWVASTTPEGEFSDLVEKLVEAEGSDPGEPFGTPFASDVGCLIESGGVEAITFGPGDIAHAHRVDERVDLGEVETAARVVAAVARTLLLADDGAKGTGWTAG